MARQTLGIDLGTNSIGLSLRNPDLGENIKDQLEYFESIIFESGVGNGKSGEFSYAAERTKYRSTRRNYMARKYRLWATLQLLIDENLCPMTQEQLDRWSKYDKSKGLKRQYPIDAYDFEQWIRLDFDGDGKPDYSSPYQLRAELMERQFDFESQTDRYKFGRAIYHIAQRRGFKSSKGETKDEQEEKANKAEQIIDAEEVDLAQSLQLSEKKKSKDITAYMDEHHLKTVGCAMAHLENAGVRVRGSIYTPIRTQYKQEIIEIFNFQEQLSTDSDLFRRLTSERKHDGTIFYKRPLRSQKGNVGNCMLEPNHKRCPISHPEFEEFRAWSVINNIKYRTDVDSDWQQLPIDLRQKMFEDRFMLSRGYFKFEDLRKWIEKELGLQLTYSRDSKTVNYPDRTSISGCPVCYRLKEILGEDWRTKKIETVKDRVNRKTGETHKVSYNYEDLWHVSMTYEDPKAVSDFAENAGISTKGMMGLWNAIQQGYANLSLKAIRNINRFLRLGLIYTDAALLAKIPDIVGAEIWNQCETQLLDCLEQINADNRLQKRLLNIVNDLISRYKMRNIEHQYAYKNTDYQLSNSDFADIDRCIKESFRKKEWDSLTAPQQQEIKSFVADAYQAFFANPKREYYSLPQLGEAIRQFLQQWAKDIPAQKWNRLYHPSKVEYFAPVAPQNINVDNKVMNLRLLPSPTLGSIKNPMALRVLHVLRRQLNGLMKEGLLNEDTKIVVETARELNDANMRWAIKTFQAKNEDANKEIAKAIKDLTKKEATEEDIRKTRLLVEQHQEEDSKKRKSDAKPTALLYEKETSELIKKYKLWLEQGCRSIYTGNVISITELLDGNKTDIEHTIPRSLSFDNSLANLTVCESEFNRKIKLNKIPTQLSNHEEIMLRIEPWIKKVEHLKDQVEQWKQQSKRAADKDRKDKCIRQMHLWRMELEYWEKKVKTFTLQADELTTGFRNSQLVDTRIITKYAYHFLKSAFNNVEVQKGEITATFRKILGVQSQDEKKDRSRHSHHAIDATMLTLVPSAAKRDCMLQLFYDIDELKRFGLLGEVAAKQTQLAAMVKECGFGHADGLAEWIDSQVLVDLVSKDRSLEPAKRKLRRNGKIVEGKWAQGDSIRASLHKDTYYGAVKYPKLDDDGHPVQVDGKWEYELDKDGREIISMVKRIPIGDIDEKSVEAILDPHVRLSVKEALRKKKEGLMDKDAPIFLLDKNGNEIRFDKNGRQLNPLRHVRCKAKAGRGYLGFDTTLHIKQQTYLSDKEYKQSYHVQNDDNYLCLLYEGVVKGKTERAFRLLNYFEVVQSGVKDAKEIANEPYYKTFLNGKKELFLTGVIKKGCRMLFWEQTPDELLDLDREQLVKRLFVVDKFNNTGSDHVYLHNHIYAGDNPEPKEYTQYETQFNPLKLQVTANKMNALIEHRDFEIDVTGKIIFL